MADDPSGDDDVELLRQELVAFVLAQIAKDRTKNLGPDIEHQMRALVEDVLENRLKYALAEIEKRYEQSLPQQAISREAELKAAISEAARQAANSASTNMRADWQQDLRQVSDRIGALERHVADISKVQQDMDETNRTFLGWMMEYLGKRGESAPAGLSDAAVRKTRDRLNRSWRLPQFVTRYRYWWVALAFVIAVAAIVIFVVKPSTISPSSQPSDDASRMDNGFQYAMQLPAQGDDQIEQSLGEYLCGAQGCTRAGIGKLSEKKQDFLLTTIADNQNRCGADVTPGDTVVAALAQQIQDVAECTNQVQGCTAESSCRFEYPKLPQNANKQQIMHWRSAMIDWFFWKLGHSQ